MVFQDECQGETLVFSANYALFDLLTKTEAYATVRWRTNEDRPWWILQISIETNWQKKSQRTLSLARLYTTAVVIGCVKIAKSLNTAPP